jgi:hypothetical protein
MDEWKSFNPAEKPEDSNRMAFGRLARLRGAEN